MLALRDVLEILGVIVCGGAVFSILLVIGARLLNNPPRGRTHPGAVHRGQRARVELPDAFGGVPATGAAPKAGTEPVIGSSGFNAPHAPEPGSPDPASSNQTTDDAQDETWWGK